MNAEALHDEQLITLLKQGDKAAEQTLYERYKPVVRSRARTYFLVGADHEDLVEVAKSLFGIIPAEEISDEKIKEERVRNRYGIEFDD